MKVDTRSSRPAAIDQLLRWRWPIVACMVLASAAAEAIDLFHPGPATFDLPLLWHALLESVLFPAIVAVSLVALARVRARMSVAQDEAARAERLQISQEIHDSLAQQLGYICLQLEHLSHATDGYVQRGLQNTLGVAQDAYAEVRSMLGELRSAAGADLVDELCSQAQAVAARTNAELRFESRGQVLVVRAGVRRQLVYIYREALSNVEKHAVARHIDVLVAGDDGELTVRVTDDGRGFDPASASDEAHFGLEIMREQARALGASLAITSQPGAGTEVVLHVPVPAMSGPGNGPMPI